MALQLQGLHPMSPFILIIFLVQLLVDAHSIRYVYLAMTPLSSVGDGLLDPLVNIPAFSHWAILFTKCGIETLHLGSKGSLGTLIELNFNPELNNVELNVVPRFQLLETDVWRFEFLGTSCTEDAELEDSGKAFFG